MNDTKVRQLQANADHAFDELRRSLDELLSRRRRAARRLQRWALPIAAVLVVTGVTLHQRRRRKPARDAMPMLLSPALELCTALAVAATLRAITVRARKRATPAAPKRVGPYSSPVANPPDWPQRGRGGAPTNALGTLRAVVRKP